MTYLTVKNCIRFSKLRLNQDLIPCAPKGLMKSDIR